MLAPTFENDEDTLFDEDHEKYAKEEWYDGIPAHDDDSEIHELRETPDREVQHEPHFEIHDQQPELPSEQGIYEGHLQPIDISLRDQHADDGSQSAPDQPQGFPLPDHNAVHEQQNMQPADGAGPSEIASYHGVHAPPMDSSHNPRRHQYPPPHHARTVMPHSHYHETPYPPHPLQVDDGFYSRYTGRQPPFHQSQPPSAMNRRHRGYPSDYQQIQVVGAVPPETRHSSSMAEQMQLMMMNQMMMQQMAAQQMQAVQMAALTGQNQPKAKRPKRPKVNIKSRQIRSMRPMVEKFGSAGPMAVSQVETSATSLESAAMENWQEATIILCIAIVGLIYLVVSRNSKEQEKEASLAAKHLVPKT